MYSDFVERLILKSFIDNHCSDLFPWKDLLPSADLRGRALTTKRML